MMHGFIKNITKRITNPTFKGFCKEKMFPDIMEFRDPKSGEIVTTYAKKPSKYSNFKNRYGTKVFIKRGKAKNIELEAKVLRYFANVGAKVIALPEVKDSSFGYELRLIHSPYKDLESLIIPFLGKSFPKYIEEHLKEYVLQIAKIHAYGPTSFLNANNKLISEENYYNRFNNLINKKHNGNKRFDEILSCYKTIANVLGNSKIKTFVKDARLKNAFSSIYKQYKNKNNFLFNKIYGPYHLRFENIVFSYISILNKKGYKFILEDEKLRKTLHLYLSVLGSTRKSGKVYLPVDKKLKEPMPLDLSILKNKKCIRHFEEGKLKTALSFCLQVLKDYEPYPFNKRSITIDGRYILEKDALSYLIDFDTRHLRLAPPQHDLSKMLLFSVKDRKKFLDTYIETYNSDVKVYNNQCTKYGIKPEIKDNKEFEFVFLNSIVDYTLFCMVEKKYIPFSKFYKSQIENATYAIDELKNNWQNRYTKQDLEQLDYIRSFLLKGV